MDTIKSLQHMLNQIAILGGKLPRITETGTFDEPTLESVMLFQRDYAPPVTGIVDQNTWENITHSYYEHLNQYSKPPEVRVLPSGHSEYTAGQRAHAVRIAQSMFTELSQHVTNFPHVDQSGQISQETQQCLKAIQKLSGLAQNGFLNRATWAALVRLYEAIVIRDAYR